MNSDTRISTPEEYIASLQDLRKKTIQTLFDTIRNAASNLQPFMQSGMIGFGKYHYKYASGREGDWFVIGLASQKNYISLYNCMSIDGTYATEKWKSRLGKVNCGKSCIRFTALEDIDLTIVTAMVKEAEAIAIQHDFVFDSTQKKWKKSS